MRGKTLFIIIVMAVLVFTLSCSGRDNQTKTGEYIDFINAEKIFSEEVKGLLDNEYVDDEIKKILEASAPLKLPESTYDKISRAFLEGEIDRKTEALLILQAVYSPENLPEKYAGATYEDGNVSIMSEVQWLINHSHELDPATEEMVRPFIVPATRPDSYFHPAFSDNENSLKNLSLEKRAYAAEVDWSVKNITISGAPSGITLFYREKGLPEEKKLEIEMQLLEIEEALKKAWPKFRELLSLQPQHELEIILTDKLAAGGIARYYTVSEQDDSISVYQIMLNENYLGDMLKSITVHELFHVFQFEMTLTWYDKSKDLLWLLEATAVWSEDYLQEDLYPTFNAEHRYLKEFFGNLNHDRLSTFGRLEYGSYLLFYFLTDYWGTKNDIPLILNAATYEKDSMDIRGMLMREFGEDIKHLYGKFALYNWNTEPHRKYSDTPHFPPPPDPTMPWGDCVEVYDINVKEEKNCDVLMGIGGIAYQKFVFSVPPEDVPFVRFDFENELPKADNNDYVKRQALIKIGGNWKYEDWTDLKYREFCRKNDEENVQTVVLIYSNAYLLDMASYEYTVATGDCPLRGYTKVKYELYSEAEGVVVSHSFELYSKEEVEYSFLKDAYVLKNREATYNSSSSSEIPNPFQPEGGTQKIRKQTVGSGSIYEKYDEEDQIVKFLLTEDGTVKLFMFPDTKTNGWITYTESGYGANGVRQKNYPNNMIRGSVELEHGNKTFTMPSGEKITQNCSISEEAISGRFTITSQQSMGTGTYTVEFEYRR